MKFTEFLKTKAAIGAGFMSIFYAIVLLSIFLPGYKASQDNMDELKIALVNDDQSEIGVQIETQLKESLPFKTINTDISNSEALKALEKNEYSLVIHIPENFSANAQSGNSTSIDFTVNGASATAVPPMMKSIVDRINNQLGANFSQQTAESILMQFNVQEQQAAELAAKIENAYKGNFTTINEIPSGTENTILPMFITTAAYVGAMIAAIQLVGLYRQHSGEMSRVRLFIYVQATALLIGVLAMIGAVAISFWITDVDTAVIWKVALQQTLLYIAAFNVSAIPIFLFGAGGMVLNIAILLMQTNSNGSTIPREMMYLPYEWFSYITPMYYSVQAYFATMFGSTSSAPYILGLVAVLVGALIINIILASRPQKKEKTIPSQSTTTK